MPTPASARKRLALWILAVPVLLGSLLRVALLAAFHPGAFSPAASAACLAVGVLLDLLTATVLAAPLLAGLAVLPVRAWQSPRLRFACWTVYGGALVFHAFVQWFFFEEFEARFNHVALDYLLYPTEVFTNLGQSYDIPLFAGLALGGGLALAWIARRALAGIELPRLPWRRKLAAAGASTALAAAGAGALWALPARWRSDRVENELAQNGSLSLVHAFATASLDWHLYYPTLPSDAAAARSSRVLQKPAPATRTEPAAGAPMQVVVVLEESFGSDFVGVLGHPERKLTPEFDRWSAEGLLLTHLVANGNRTVRGLEGVLASFVPLPGDAILKRDKSDDVATLARVFRAHGYSTGFFYGGYAVFDSMRSFLSRNGWEEFVEQPDYPADAFSTAWGVADRWIFEALLERQLRAREKHERLFATLLSVSNHKPYRIPPESPVNQRVPPGRSRGVAYADECIGVYLDRLKAAGLLQETLVLVVGDHGARVYGSERIPAPSYRIPALFLSPEPRWRGARIGRLCSQIDLAPTLLELAGLPTPAPFLGTSLLGQDEHGGRAFLQHNRDVGMLTDTALVVLGLNKTVEFYSRDSKDTDAFSPVEPAAITPELRALALDATAVFQAAYERYEARDYRLELASAR